jgi:hypothetical protein
MQHFSQMNNLSTIAFIAISAIGVYIVDAIDNLTNKPVKENILPVWNDDKCLKKTIIRKVPSSVVIDV